MDVRTGRRRTRHGTARRHRGKAAHPAAARRRARTTRQRRTPRHRTPRRRARRRRTRRRRTPVIRRRRPHQAIHRHLPRPAPARPTPRRTRQPGAPHRPRDLPSRFHHRITTRRDPLTASAVRIGAREPRRTARIYTARSTPDPPDHHAQQPVPATCPADRLEGPCRIQWVIRGTEAWTRLPRSPQAGCGPATDGDRLRYHRTRRAPRRR